MTDLAQLEATLRAAFDRKKYRKVDFFKPYPKQVDFFDAGGSFRERLLMAGNQVGKTYCGGAEAAFHATGEYPDDWFGRRFDHPTKGWVVGLTGLAVRDLQQTHLCGEPGVEDSFGSGMIPKERFVDKPSMARGVTDAFDTIQVEHRTNGIVDGTSIIRFKSYEQGRKKMQGESIDWAWLDEEPPEDVYGEILTRTTATGGMLFMTFTPLEGMSKVVCRFLLEKSPNRHVTTMTIHDALHIPKEKVASIIAGYAEHERDARSMGKPIRGSGLIFPFSEEQIREPALAEVPAHWFKLWGIDFGIGHPFGAVLIAWDKDADQIHVLHAIKVPGQMALQHCQPILRYAGEVPVAWPQDGHQKDKGSGLQLAKQYKDHGLKMLDTHAKWLDGTRAVEPGLMEMSERMASGRLKVAGHLSAWFEELRLYGRHEGEIVKMWDDLMDPTRYAIMMKRFARQVPLGSTLGRKPRRQADTASDIDFDVFA